MPENPDELLLLPPDLFSRNKVIATVAGLLMKNKTTNWRVADVGGYNGQLAKFLPSSAQLTIIDQKPKPEKETVEYKQADARKIPFSDHNFEVVVSSDLLEHLEQNDRLKVVNELLRIAKNYVIIGFPSCNTLTQKAEELVNHQFLTNAKQEHPFLKEHQSFGLPNEEEIEQFLNTQGIEFYKIHEGNLMNWYIQQLYIGTQYGEPPEDQSLQFYRFFNEHLKELGTLRSPAYRVIYILNKQTAKKALPKETLDQTLQEQFTWNAAMFMDLLHYAFDDLRKVLERKKQYGEKVAKARKAVDAYKTAIHELRNFLQEKQQVIHFLRALMQEKDNTINELEEKNNQLLHDCAEQIALLNETTLQLSEAEQENKHLHTVLTKNEAEIEQKNAMVARQEAQLKGLESELGNHKKTLQEILNSRAWRTVMVYSRIKMALLVKPWRLVKKAWSIFRIQGPKTLFQKIFRKLRKAPTVTENSAYDLYIARTRLTPADLQKKAEEMKKFKYQPTISIVMPVYNIEEKWLVKAIESVRNQIYPRWELCMADDASTQAHVKPLLKKYAAMDKRIKVDYRSKNGGIVKASNDALKLASGAYIGLLDDDDELTPDALFEVVKNLQETKHDLIYSDEDKIEMNGKRCEPFFKPDWSPDLLLSINYISHFGVYRRKIVEEIGGFREGFDGSQDYDVVLRFTEKARSIYHIPKILYHWRKIPGSTAVTVDAKPYVFEAAREALREALKRRNIAGEVSDGLWHGSYRVKRSLDSSKKVSIIIPFKDKVEVLKVCVESILAKSTYPNYEILLVNNQSQLAETGQYLAEIARHPLVKILEYDYPFNFSAINNYAAQEAEGEYLLLLNNDTEVIAPEWIEALLEHAQRPEVGAAGAKLLYPNNTIQHAGVLIGVGGIANHAFCKQSRDDHGYFGQVDLIRNVSAVTGACMMVRKDVYQKMNGLNEQDLAVAFNDVDFCLRLRDAGYLIIYTPYAQLYHYESLSRGYDVNLKEVAYIERTHRGLLQKGDPYYNPNLSRERFDYSLRVGDKS